MDQQIEMGRKYTITFVAITKKLLIVHFSSEWQNWSLKHAADSITATSEAIEVVVFIL